MFHMEFRTEVNAVPENRTLLIERDIEAKSVAIKEMVAQELVNSTTGLDWEVDNINITSGSDYVKEAEITDEDIDKDGEDLDEETDFPDITEVTTTPPAPTTTTTQTAPQTTTLLSTARSTSLERLTTRSTQATTRLNTTPRTTVARTVRPSTRPTFAPTTLPEVVINTAIPSATADQSGEMTTSVANSLTCHPTDLIGHCRTLFYSCTNGTKGSVFCENNNSAISLEIMPFPFNRSACTIQFRLPLSRDQTLDNFRCPWHRQYQQYNCSERVGILYWGMDDFGYDYECCPDGQSFNETRSECADCGDSCQVDDSDDETSA